jgi:hypothetical protein
MATTTQYQVVFHFRNGKVLNLNVNKVVTKKGPGASLNYLYIDNEPVASLGKSPGQVFVENQVVFNNASPLPKLFDLMPEDWDKEDPPLRIIEVIKIFTQKVTKE